MLSGKDGGGVRLRIPYGVLMYYVDSGIRVFLKENPLQGYPAVYEGRLAAVFEDPPSILLEEAESLVLNFVPLKNYFEVLDRRALGAVFVNAVEIRFFEILEDLHNVSRRRILSGPKIPSDREEKRDSE